MKKYKIKFLDDYLKYEEWSKDTSGSYIADNWKVYIEESPDKIEMCRKWTDKEITLLELEDLITEFGEVIFDGNYITINNGYID